MDFEVPGDSLRTIFEGPRLLKKVQGHIRCAREDVPGGDLGLFKIKLKAGEVCRCPGLFRGQSGWAIDDSILRIRERRGRIVLLRPVPMRPATAADVWGPSRYPFPGLEGARRGILIRHYIRD